MHTRTETTPVNLYYKIIYGRQNIIKEYLYHLFLGLASFPKMLLEMFIRTEFGIRYYSTSGVIILAALLGGAPIILDEDIKYRFFDHYLTWYAYIGAFLYFAYLRWKEVKHNFSTFDFGHFTLYSGNIHPLLLRYIRHPKFDTPNIRRIETLVEPAIFFIAGLLLFMMKQPLGLLLIPCSIIYSLSYMAAYHKGDGFVWDIIDNKICNEQTANTFAHNRPPQETKGFQFRGARPESMDDRWKTMDGFFGRDNGSSIVR